MNSRNENIRDHHCRQVARKHLKAIASKLVDGVPADLPIITSLILPDFQVQFRDLGSQSGFMLLNEKAIYINSAHAPTRQRFTIAHEIGHVLLGHPPADKLSTEEKKSIEAEANIFAGEFLVPYDSLKSSIAKGLKIDALAKKFFVSQEVLFIRLKDSRLFNKVSA